MEFGRVRSETITIFTTHSKLAKEKTSQSYSSIRMFDA